MKIAIRYHSESGNTEKLANAASQISGVPSYKMNMPLEDDVDLLFLGSAVYGAGVADDVKQFIASLKPGQVKNVVCFSTAALMPSSYGAVSKLLKAKNIPVDLREFHCRGEFKFAHKGRPNENDIEKFKTFVKEILKS